MRVLYDADLGRVALNVKILGDVEHPVLDELKVRRFHRVRAVQHEDEVQGPVRIQAVLFLNSKLSVIRGNF